MTKNQCVAYYRLSVKMSIALEIAKLITSSPAYGDLYRYSKLVDASDKGFDCTNAVSLSRLIDISNTSDSYNRLNQLLEASRLLDSIPDADLYDKVMDSKE